MTDRPPEWDDERLAAGFAERAAAAPPPPSDLLPATLERLDAGRRRTWWSLPLGVAAGLVVIVVASAVVLSGTRLQGPSDPISSPAGRTAPAAGSPTAPSPSALASGQLPVRSVSEAIATRDATKDPVEITVGGWLRDGVVVPCAVTPPPRNPTRLECPQARPWIVEDQADSGAGRLNGGPSGPGFQPSFALVDDSAVERSGDAASVPLAITGHFHDRRATLCAGPECDATFVVDRIDAVGGVPQPITSVDLGVDAERDNTTSGVDIAPVGNPEQHDSIVSAGAGWTLLGRRQMSLDGLVKAEPGLLAGWPPVGTSSVVTEITILDPDGPGGEPRARTFLVPEPGTSYFEMTEAGPSGSRSVPAQPRLSLTDRLGDPISVADAIAHRDQALDDTELLVNGLVWGYGNSLGCTLVRPGMPVLDQCPSTSQWVSDVVPARTSEPGALLQPTGPAMNLVVPPESANLAPMSESPTRQVVLGHFDDRRAESCGTALLERCRRNFIVDAILDPHALDLTPIDLQTKRPAPSDVPRGTADWAANAAGIPPTARPDRLISVFPVAVAALGAIEPDAQRTPAMSGVETVWLVHFLDTIVTDKGGVPVVRTRIVLDGDPVSGPATVYDATKDGLERAWTAAVP